MPVTHENIIGGLLRFGPGHLMYGDDYDFSVTYDLQGDWAVIKGFYHKNISRDQFEAVIGAINMVTGRLVAYERAGNPPIRMYQRNPGLTNGRIVMTHRHHAAHEAKHADGTVDQKVVIATTLEAIAAAVRGELVFTSLSSTISPDGKTASYSFGADIVSK